MSEVVEVNPLRPLVKGETVPHVAMDQLPPFTRQLASYSLREFKGSGSRLRNGDTLLARITPCLENGKTALVRNLPDTHAWGSTEFIVLAGKEGVSNDLYVYYVATSPQFRGFAIPRMEGSSGRQRVPASALDQFIFDLPPLDEQQAIVSVLGSLDDKIELNRRMNETLEALARTLFKSWFVDFDPVRTKMEGRKPFGMDDETAALFPDSFEDSPLGEIPKGWRAEALSSVIEVNPRRSLPKGQSAPHLDMKNMPTKGHYPVELTERDFGSGTKFVKGDTLLARITPCLENGKTAFVDFLNDGQVGWGSTEYIVLRPKPPLPIEYAYYLARSESLRTYAIQNMVGSSGRQRVPAQCFDSYFVAVPPEDIALRFGETAAQFMGKIRANHEQSTTLAAIRDALLPKLLSGEVRVEQAKEMAEEAV